MGLLLPTAEDEFEIRALRFAFGGTGFISGIGLISPVVESGIACGIETRSETMALGARVNSKSCVTFRRFDYAQRAVVLNSATGNNTSSDRYINTSNHHKIKLHSFSLLSVTDVNRNFYQVQPAYHPRLDPL